MARNAREIEKAFQIYLQVRTVEGVGRVTEIPVSTLRKWSLKYKWKDRLEKILDEGAVGDPTNTPIIRQSQDIELSPQGKMVLEEVNTVESICMATIRGTEESREREEDDGKPSPLRPKTFTEAMNALDKCWRMRGQLFSTIGNSTKEQASSGKMPYIENLTLIANSKKNESEGELD
jgi:hypothetical protein